MLTLQSCKHILKDIYEKCFGYWFHRANRLRTHSWIAKRYGNDNIVAGFIKGAEPTGELKETGPAAEADVTNPEMIANVVKTHKVDTIYNLAALLSVVAENKPRLAWKIGVEVFGTSWKWHGKTAVLCSLQVQSGLSDQVLHVCRLLKILCNALELSMVYQR